MKVCILTSVHPPFDPRIFYKEAKSLLEAGYGVTLVAPADFQERVVDGVRVLGLPKYKSRAYRPLNWYRILRIALKEKADIYHFHDPELLPAGVLIRLLTGRPVIYDVHENYVEDILTKPWIPKPLRKVVSLAFRVLEAASVRLVDGVIVVNEQLAKRFSRNPSTIVVSNYSRVERFQSNHGESKWKERFGEPYFVYAGIISDDRGIYDCIQAFQSLGRSEVRLVCAGRATIVRDQRLRLALDTPQAIEDFEYLGHLPYTDIPGLLKGALAGLLCFKPTPNNLLGTPNKLFEYMSSGIPVIASDFPYIRQVIKATDCGILVQADNVEDIASAMTYILENPEEGHRLGENGLRAVIEQYNWEVEQKKLLRLYEAVLGKDTS